MPKPRTAFWMKCLELSLIIWGAELLFIRVTGDAQPLSETLLTAAIYLAVTGPLVLLSERFVPLPVKPYTTALSVGLPAIYVSAGYPLIKLDSALVALAAVFGLVAAVPLVVTVWRRKRFALPSAWQVVAPVLLSMVITSVIRTGSPPPFSLGGLLLVGAALLSLAPTRRYGAPLALTLLFIVTLVPGRLETGRIRWHSGGRPGTGPDIVLIIVDTLRADIARKMKVYDRIRQDGVEHRRTQSAAPWTLPAIASILTGRTAGEHGAVRSEEKQINPIDDDLATLPEQLSALGYDCFAAVSKNPYILGKFGFDRGFAVYDWAGSFDYESAWLGRYPRVRPAILNAIVDYERRLTGTFLHPILDWLPQHWDSDYVVDRALALAEKRRGDRPLFLLVHLLDPHLPYKHAYKAALPPSIQRQAISLRAGKVRGKKRWHSARGRHWLRNGYTNEVEVADAALMRFLDGLGAPGPRGRVVMLTSDHGEELFDHGGFEHGHTFYQELLHVPLVVSGLPKKNRLGYTKPGRVVGSIDIAPALIEAAGGARARAAKDGYLSESLLYGDPDPERSWAVRRENLKAILQEGEGRLFNLGKDPRERRPLKGVTAKKIDGFRERVVKNAKKRKRKPRKRIEMTPEERRALQELGYLSE